MIVDTKERKREREKKACTSSHESRYLFHTSKQEKRTKGELQSIIFQSATQLNAFHLKFCFLLLLYIYTARLAQKYKNNQ